MRSTNPLVVGDLFSIRPKQVPHHTAAADDVFNNRLDLFFGQ
jgi:hypothetical protein